MTMIPPKIKKLPGLRKGQSGYIAKPQQGSVHANKDLFMGASKMVK